MAQGQLAGRSQHKEGGEECHRTTEDVSIKCSKYIFFLKAAVTALRGLHEITNKHNLLVLERGKLSNKRLIKRFLHRQSSHVMLRAY